MEDLPLIIKFAEVVAMEVLVGVAVVGLLIAVVRDIVESKVQKSRLEDQITLAPSEQPLPAQKPVAQKPAAHQPANLIR